MNCTPHRASLSVLPIISMLDFISFGVGFESGKVFGFDLWITVKRDHLLSFVYLLWGNQNTTPGFPTTTIQNKGASRRTRGQFKKADSVIFASPISCSGTDRLLFSPQAGAMG